MQDPPPIVELVPIAPPSKLVAIKEAFKILVLLVCLIIACNFLIWLPVILDSVTATLSNVNRASVSLAHSSEAQEKLFTDKKTLQGIAVLARKADDLARLIDKGNNIADQVNRETLPEVTKTIAQGRATLQAGETVLITTNGQIAGLGEKAQADLNAIRVLLEDPNIKGLFANLNTGTAKANTTLDKTNLTLADIQEAIPALRSQLEAILSNTTGVTGNTKDLTGEMAVFMRGVNKPLTKKQKALKYLIQILTIAAPVAVKR